MSPVEVGLFSLCHLQLNEISNNELRRFELDFLNERRNDSQINLDTNENDLVLQI